MRGYDVTTNRGIASLVGITSGALYHYFESKLDLYLAVYRDVQREILEVLSTAAASESTFERRFAAILDATLEMNLQDPSVGRFNGAVRVDIRRHPDIGAAVRTKRDPIESFFAHLISEGVDSGEIREQDVPLMGAFIRTVLLGITAGLSDDPDFQSVANEGVKRAFAGLLLR